jgi:hypothetical protein
METIYLDHAAGTPVRPEALEALLPWFSRGFANPSSLHGSGQEARRALEEARERVAAFLGADPAEILFTAGGTESDNAKAASRAGRPDAISSRAKAFPGPRRCADGTGSRFSRPKSGPFRGERLRKKLCPLGRDSLADFLLTCHIGDYELAIFPTGGVLVRGTTDIALARALAARCIGM